MKSHAGAENIGVAGKSHPARGAWIEIPVKRAIGFAILSHPARGAWIEIDCVCAG